MGEPHGCRSVRSATQTSIASFDRNEQNAIRRPSGENCGLLSNAGDWTSGRDDPPGSNR
jgi:hypothetical protein